MQGAILLRRIDEIVHPEAARYVNEIYDALRRKKRRDDYALAASKATGPTLEPGRLLAGERLLPTELVTSDLAIVLGDRSEATLQRDLDLLQDRSRLTEELLREGAQLGTATSPAVSGDAGVSAPTTPESLRPYVRVSVNLAAILSGEQDIELRPNDILVVSSQPQTVMVMGEVSAPLALPYVDRGRSAITAQAGGATRDADLANPGGSRRRGAPGRHEPRRRPRRHCARAATPAGHSARP